ncbi:MAG TPA: peptidylprolyl isomerase [Longimicrobiales bacterium]|nr:peptidylprolyl isomerase [Longimicrobiales bacterium]
MVGGRAASVAAVLALALSTCGEAPAPALRIGPIEYGAQELGALSAGQRRDLATLSGFGAAVAEGRLRELVAPAVTEKLDSATLRRLQDEVALRRSGLSAEAIEAAYLEDPELELTVRHLVLLADEAASLSAAGRAQVRAVGARNRILAGEDFASVAAEVSEEPGAAARGGLLRPARRGDWVEPFWEAAEALEPGDISPVVRTVFGFHVLRVEERRILPLEEVRRDIAGRLVPGEHARLAARAWADSVAGAATDGHAALLREAERHGLAATAAERERATRDVVLQAQAWAIALDFGAEAEPAEVKSAAMAALASERQGVALARAAVLERADLVRRLYPGDPASSSEAVHADTSA